MTIGERAVRYAEREAKLGAREIGGNNKGPWVKKYLNANHPEDEHCEGLAWCVAFFCWCWIQACKEMRVPLPFRFTRGAKELWERLVPLRRAHASELSEPDEDDQQRVLAYPTYVPKPGDPVFLLRETPSQPGHVTMCHHVDGDGRLHSIGGNEGKPPCPVHLTDQGPLLEVPKLFGYGEILIA